MEYPFLCLGYYGLCLWYFTINIRNTWKTTPNESCDATSYTSHELDLTGSPIISAINSEGFASHKQTSHLITRVSGIFLSITSSHKPWLAEAPVVSLLPLLSFPFFRSVCFKALLTYVFDYFSAIFSRVSSPSRSCLVAEKIIFFFLNF